MYFKLIALFLILSLVNCQEQSSNSTSKLFEDLPLPQVCFDAGVSYCYILFVIICAILVCVCCCVISCLCC